MTTKLKLFVWDSFYPDYTDGFAIAIAETKEEAIQLLTEQHGSPPNEYWGNVKELPLSKCAYYQSGCG